MDDRRFDSLARAWAGQSSRRGLLRGAIVAALLAALPGSRRDAAAHHGVSGPGDPCRHDDQCRAADAPLICAWNGFGYDGGFNCCTYEGSNCADDSWCCWDNICVGGTCTSPSCTGQGCACWQGQNDPDPCDPGLVCCLGANNSGTCLPLYTCTGTGAPGDDCPRYCLPGPTQCPSCVSGYCTAAGVCG